MIVDRLGGIPLALAQAAAYVMTTAIDFKNYLRKLETNLTQILSKPFRGHSYGNGNIFSCWKLSFDALSPDAARLLNLCAFLSNEDIPEELLYRGMQAIYWLHEGKHPKLRKTPSSFLQYAIRCELTQT